MNIQTMKTTESKTPFRGNSSELYNEVVDELVKLKKGEMLKIECGQRKPATIFGGVRTRLIKLGVYKEYTSHIVDDILYMTRR